MFGAAALLLATLARAQSAPPSAVDTTAQSAKASLTDRDPSFRKHLEAQAKASAAALQEAQRKQAQAKDCANAQNYKNLLETRRTGGRCRQRRQ